MFIIVFDSIKNKHIASTVIIQCYSGVKNIQRNVLQLTFIVSQTWLSKLTMHHDECGFLCSFRCECTQLPWMQQRSVIFE